ncbi:insulinase family protein [Serratia symbiotica]|uniref:insulinase family protein n=1 Tax=Serratia symbiotica TaxID=138074 RepID=UPI001D58C6FC|nr:insulinase family protein [Serratia symbiotica]
MPTGFSWQLFSTPQRPNDRIELRLRINTGSLAESSQQIGSAHLLPRLSLGHSGSFSTLQLRSLWQQSIDDERPLSLAISSYDFTIYNLSLPNNRPDLLKDALVWLSDITGKLALNEHGVQAVMSVCIDPVGTFPPNLQDAWWRYRLKDSTLAAQDPAQPVKLPVNIAQLKKFYHQWYTPDAMALYVVGRVDSRGLGEQINEAFSALKGKREIPATMLILAPLPPQPVSLTNELVKQDRLAMIWDAPRHPIRDARNLGCYWRSNLAHEALFWHLPHTLEKSDHKPLQLGFDCRVQYQRARCAIHLDTPNNHLNSSLGFISHELVNVRNNRLPEEAFINLLAQKKDQLSKLFAAYAHTGTDVLMSQRLGSQQRGVVDIALEQYQRLRQTSLFGLTLEALDWELKLQLSQDVTLVVKQPEGEPEMSMKQLQETYSSIMSTASCGGESGGS